MTEPYSAMAKALNVSARTVRRRVEKMSSEGAMSAIASTDYRAVTNDIFAYLMAEYEEPEARGTVNERLFAALVRYLWVTGLGESYSVFFLNLPNVATSEEVLDRVKSVDGVKAARIEILAERVELYDLFRQNVDEKLREIRAREIQVAE